MAKKSIRIGLQVAQVAACLTVARVWPKVNQADTRETVVHGGVGANSQRGLRPFHSQIVDRFVIINEREFSQ